MLPWLREAFYGIPVEQRRFIHRCYFITAATSSTLPTVRLDDGVKAYAADISLCISDGDTSWTNIIRKVCTALNIDRRGNFTWTSYVAISRHTVWDEIGTVPSVETSVINENTQSNVMAHYISDERYHFYFAIDTAHAIATASPTLNPRSKFSEEYDTAL